MRPVCVIVFTIYMHSSWVQQLTNLRPNPKKISNSSQKLQETRDYPSLQTSSGYTRTTALCKIPQCRLESVRRSDRDGWRLQSPVWSSNERFGCWSVAVDARVSSVAREGRRHVFWEHALHVVNCHVLETTWKTNWVILSPPSCWAVDRFSFYATRVSSS